MGGALPLPNPCSLLRLPYKPQCGALGQTLSLLGAESLVTGLHKLLAGTHTVADVMPERLPERDASDRFLHHRNHVHREMKTATPGNGDEKNKQGASQFPKDAFQMGIQQRLLGGGGII